VKVAELIRRRQESWRELELLCTQLGKQKSRNPQVVVRFTELYRAACADLALADAYQLPPSTVEYLHLLVARAHNQLYRSKSFQWRLFADRILIDTPRLIFRERCVHIAFFLFWGLFALAGYLAYEQEIWPTFAEEVCGAQQLDDTEKMFADFEGRSWGENSAMMGYYIWNNAGIGLRVFVNMLLVLPGLIELTFNAVYLGSVFGYMFRPELGDSSLHFKEFVTAHGPFELTAIILSAGAGLKIGMGWIVTKGLTRKDSLIKAGREGLPIVMCAVVLFFLAAFVEGFISPSPLPWWFKGMVGALSSCAMMFYFIVLGYQGQP
jgi:uncharacterized membrane protein SpoIIM required for sporulation